MKIRDQGEKGEKKRVSGRGKGRGVRERERGSKKKRET